MNPNDHQTNEQTRDGRRERDLNRLTPEERYQRDPAFHALVTMLRGAIARADYTPTEIREAAMLAAIMYEMGRPARPVLMREGDPEWP